MRSVGTKCSSFRSVEGATYKGSGLPVAAQRDEINAKVMADPRLKAEMANTPFDGKRMIYGGFETFLEL